MILVPALVGRHERQMEVAAEIERDLELLGVTGVEDKLQA